MKRAFLVGLGLAVALVALAVALPALRARLHEVGVAPPSAPSSKEAAPPGVSAPPSPAPGVSPPPTPPALAAKPVPDRRPPLKAVGKARLDAQIRKVVESMERTSQPPAGVAQGGRRGSQRAVFQNLERRLPVKPSGYYRETDVWPRGAGSRGPERLVFGGEAEVYYTKDHYRSFVRLR